MNRKSRRPSGLLRPRRTCLQPTPPSGSPRPRRRWWRRGNQPSPEAGPTVLGPSARTAELARIEAVLFVNREPVPVRRLAKLAGLPDGSRARALLRELQRLHDAEGAAFRVEQVGGGFQLLTRSPLGPWVRRLLASPTETRLSSASLETLAIVAYRQPATRADIEAIRGVGSEEILRQLLERDLVAVGGRTDDLGRPNVYVTTRRFLRTFGLARIEDLPPIGPADEAVAGAPARVGAVG